MSDMSKKRDEHAANLGGRPIVELFGEVRRFERRLPHRPEKVWRALTEDGELEKWFPASIEGEREEGASLRFVFRDGENEDAKGKVTRCEPPRVLAYTMGSESLRWELFPIPEGTLLVFTTTTSRPLTSSPANDNAVTAFRMAA
jgi:uncharacterized protein YndB with AHSA1/START domain